MKYDKMVEINREKNLKKVRIAQRQIRTMLEKGEKITLSKLSKSTGFSKSFFYRNQTLRPLLDEARRKQEIPCNSMDKIEAMELREKLADLNITITRLELKIEKLQIREKELISENNMLKQKLKETQIN